jgi:hypothetical protein
MAVARAISAGIAMVEAEVFGPLEGRSGAAAGVDKNPAARRNRVGPASAHFHHGERLLPFRGIETHGGPLRSEDGRL